MLWPVLILNQRWMSLPEARAAVVSDPYRLTHLLTARPLCALEIAFLVSASVVCYIRGRTGRHGSLQEGPDLWDFREQGPEAKT